MLSVAYNELIIAEIFLAKSLSVPVLTHHVAYHVKVDCRMPPRQPTVAHLGAWVVAGGCPWAARACSHYPQAGKMGNRSIITGRGNSMVDDLC